jgi:RimK family alpha-L-glutamate ligase
MLEPNPAIAIVTDDPGWHGRELSAALASRGYGSAYVSLTDAFFDLAAAPGSLRLGGFEGLPAGVFVRGIPAGSLEQTILRLDVLHLLNRMGIAVYNHPLAIERTVDKAMTSALLRLAGIPTPATWIAESPERLRAIAAPLLRRGRQLVVKPLFGSQGTGVELLESLERLDAICAEGRAAYVQERIEPAAASWSDVRVLVVAGQAKAAMRRTSNFWITNRAQGARCDAVMLDRQLSRVAEDAAGIVDIDYAGVDVIADARGELQVLEVNSIPAWKGLQSVYGRNIAELLIADFLARIEQVSEKLGDPASAA